MALNIYDFTINIYNGHLLTDLQKQTIVAHELGHGLFGNMNHNLSNTAALMWDTVSTYTGTGIPIATEKASAASMHGGANTFATKMSTGKYLGDIWSLYKGINNVNADGTGLRYWSIEFSNSAKTLAQLAAALNISAGTDTQFIANLYTRALGRAVLPAETTYYLAQIALVGRASVAVTICTSAEAVAYRVANVTSFWLS